MTEADPKRKSCVPARKRGSRSPRRCWRLVLPLDFGTGFKNPNFAVVAEASGVRGIRLEDPADGRRENVHSISEFLRGHGNI
jgi:hypothetical protein